MSSRNVINFLGFYVINQDEIGVKLNFGKFAGIAQPGLGFAVPVLQRIIKTKSSLQTIDLPDQQIVLSGNISVTISGNLNFCVDDPAKALLEVSDYTYSVRQLALTTISDVLGIKTIEQVREEKTHIADEIETIIREKAASWGLSNIDIRLTDATLDEHLLRAMMRETEAKKEAAAIQIKAQADRDVAETFCAAAASLTAVPGAMTLRVLQTLSDVSNEKATIVVPIPIDMLGGLGNVAATAESSVKELPKEAAAPSVPSAKLNYQSDQTVAICPHCDSQFNVTEVIGKMRYDRLPDVPGQQVKCGRCGEIFTLPGTE